MKRGNCVRQYRIFIVGPEANVSDSVDLREYHKRYAPVARFRHTPTASMILN